MSEMTATKSYDKLNRLASMTVNTNVEPQMQLDFQYAGAIKKRD
jgi:hypothetical protein